MPTRLLPRAEEPHPVRRLKYWVWALVSAGLLYTSGSLLVMKYLIDQNAKLVDKNTEFCQQRQVARSTIRHFFMDQYGWTQEDQELLDEGLAETVPC